MIVDRWIPQKLLIRQEVLAVEVFMEEGRTTFYYTHLRNKKNRLEITACGEVAQITELPVKLIKNKVPVLLVINGSGVVIKKISVNEENTAAEELIQVNLPALNTSEFFIQLYRGENSAFISFSRKDNVIGIMDQFRAAKLELVEVFLGVPSLIGLKPLWQAYNTIPLNGYLASLTNNELDSFIPSADKSEPLTMEGIQVNKQHTLGLAAGISYLTQNYISENTNEELLELRQKHLDGNKFRALLIATVGIAFFVSITNVVFYTHFFDKNARLDTELSVYQGKYDQVNNLLTEYQKNKDLIENAGVLNKNKLSEYSDRIGSTLPDEVLLAEMYFNPTKENDDSSDSLLTFRNKSLVLKGYCGKSFIINEWVNVLKMQKFVKQVNLERFTYSSESVLPNFEIHLVTE
jgi:hypothetical protein